MRRKLTALIALGVSACTGWRVETGPAAQATTRGAGRATSVRLLLKSGEELDLMGARVMNDSVVGYTRHGRPDFARRAVAVADITGVSTYGFDGAKTAAAVLVITVVSVALVWSCVSSFSEI